jgi:hypothetical protein
MLKELEKIVEYVHFHLLMKEKKKKMLMRLFSVFAAHPQPCSAHVQRLAPTSTVRCVSVYVSSSTCVFRREFARPCLFAIVPFVSSFVMSGHVAEPVVLFLEASCVQIWR